MLALISSSYDSGQSGPWIRAQYIARKAFTIYTQETLMEDEVGIHSVFYYACANKILAYSRAIIS